LSCAVLHLSLSSPVYICIHTRAYTHIHTHTYIHTLCFAQSYVWAWALELCTFTYAYIHIYIYAHIHIYIYTLTLSCAVLHLSLSSRVSASAESSLCCWQKFSIVSSLLNLLCKITVALTFQIFCHGWVKSVLRVETLTHELICHFA